MGCGCFFEVSFSLRVSNSSVTHAPKVEAFACLLFSDVNLATQNANISCVGLAGLNHRVVQ